MNNILKLIISIVICEGVGIVDGIATSQSVGTWFRELAKPSFNPPNWVFGPVWTLLYLMMGISLFLLWKQGWDAPGVRAAVLMFSAQLFFNGLWSFIFFGARSPAFGGLVVILILWLLIIVCILRFWNISTAASLLMVPYLLWVSFAAVLNLSFRSAQWFEGWRTDISLLT